MTRTTPGAAVEEPDWGALVERYDRVVWLRLLAQVPAERARDLKQEVWTTLIHKWRAGAYAYLQMPGLALSEADFAVRNDRRQTRCQVSDRVSEIADARLQPCLGDAEAKATAHARLARVVAAVDEAPGFMSRVFDAMYQFPGRSTQQVASELGITPTRVRQVLFELRIYLGKLS